MNRQMQCIDGASLREVDSMRSDAARSLAVATTVVGIKSPTACPGIAYNIMELSKMSILVRHSQLKPVLRYIITYL